MAPISSQPREQVSMVIGHTEGSRGVVTHLQRSHDRFAKVFGAGICAESHKVATVDMLLAYAAFTLLGPCSAFALEATSFALLSRLAALDRGV